MNPILLAFDTSTSCLSLALVYPGGVLVHESVGGALASGQLIAQARALLSRAGCVWRDLDAIAFGCGPGAFTGLRTACSVAQGMALGLGKPVLAIDSLMLVADDAYAQCPVPAPAHWWVAMDARMGEIYAASYVKKNAASPWQVVTSPALHTLPSLLALWRFNPPLALAGSALPVFGRRLQGGGAEKACWVSQPVSRAQALSRLACMLWADQQGMDAALALPVYLRDKVAQTEAERKVIRPL